MIMAQTPKKTLFVRNLPFSTTHSKLENVFSDIGPIHRCFVVGSKGSEECKGFGYVTFALLEDAKRAREQVTYVDGRKLRVDYADKKPKKPKTQKSAENLHVDSTVDVQTTDQKQHQKDGQRELNATGKQASCCVVVTGFPPETPFTSMQETLRDVCSAAEVTLGDKDSQGGNPSAAAQFHSKKDAVKAIKKIKRTKYSGHSLSAVLQSQSHSSEKTSKLIIRNLAFKVDEESLTKELSKYGSVTEVSIPTKADGKKRGFGFVQFSKVSEANSALRSLNAQALQGRVVAVDWAVPKDKFQKALTQQQKGSQQVSEDSGSFSGTDTQADETTDTTDKTTTADYRITGSDSESSSVSHSDSDSADAESSDAGSSDAESSDAGSSDAESCNAESSDAKSSDAGSSDAKSSDAESSDAGSSDAESSDADTSDAESSDVESSDAESGDVGCSESDKRKSAVKQEQKKSDVEEGRTLFIRNVSFDSDEESLAESFGQFGKLVYCRVVVDPSTEHSRGTAFVQFSKKEEAEKCLEAANEPGAGLIVDGRTLNVTVAVQRQRAQQLHKDKKEKEPKDKRNLHLAREGMIRAGTLAAQGLTQQDLNKRTKVEEVKRHKLRNPSVFVSDQRLCVRNIPVSVGDTELRKIFLKAAGAKSAKITECRVMRDLSQVNTKGLAKSRGYGFVQFGQHQWALQALRTTNNNPDLFPNKRRLIVEFSLENKSALQAKEKRTERAQAKQRLLQKAGSSETEHAGKQMKRTPRPNTEARLSAGPTAVPRGGVSKTLPSHRGPKIRHKQRPGQIPQTKSTKMAKAQKRKLVEEKKPKQKSQHKKRKGLTDNFDVLVNKYKSQLSAAVNKQGGKKASSKWFDS